MFESAELGQDEQLHRFKEREKIGFKRFKITAEDWRNREKWDAYERAVCDMVEANDENFARISILKTPCQQIEAAIKEQK